MGLLKKALDRIDFAFMYFMKLPLFLKIIAAMTMIVLPVPVFNLLDLEFYSNTEVASAFFKHYFILNNLLLLIHIGAALPAIVLGPLLLHTALRKQKPKLHARLGKIYITACLISAVTVFPLAISHRLGFVPQLGFGAMAVSWFTLTYLAYGAARARDFTAHKRWVLRSYAMTFAFVHVNLTYRLFLPYDSLSIISVKVFQSMISWQANLMCVEIYLAGTTTAGKFVGRETFIRNLTRWSKNDRFHWRAGLITPRFPPG
ncbi:MAG: DUF2306 domain-containing protein [Alphaproteobacteria bacterium]|nr:DUF2306 domain-containing protein [Alphaproteobacteria bacterium]